MLAATRIAVDIASRLPVHLPIVNRHVLDISKRRVSSMLVRPNDSLSGPVIVKSDANFAGKNDFDRLSKGRRLIRHLTHFLLHRERWPAAIPYDIYQSIADVPRRVWSSPEYVVERFIPEREGALYCLRKWIFLGDTEFQVISRSESPIVKAGRATHTFLQESVPQELIAERNRLGFDFGKFDYVMHDGRAVLLDANTTPGISGESPKLLAFADELAMGLQNWIAARVTDASQERIVR